MRSEMKMGVGIGALILVIIVGYLAIHTSDEKGATGGNTASATGSAGSPQAGASGNASTPSGTSTSATPERTAVALPVAAQPSGDNKSENRTPPSALASENAAAPGAASASPAGGTGGATGTVTISGPAAAAGSTGASPTTAPSVAVGGPAGGASSPAAETATAPAATVAPAASDATAAAKPDWNKLLDGQTASAAENTGGASIGLGGQGGTSTSSLYASGVGSSAGTGLGATGRTSPRVGGAAGSALAGSTGSSLATAPSGVATGKHVVKTGETLSSIAAAAYGSINYWPAIARANPGLNPNAMHVGQTINLPDASAVKVPVSATPDRTPAPSGSTLVVDPTKEYSVLQGDSLYVISVKLYGTPNKAEQIYQLNKATIGPSMSRLKVHQVLKLPAAPTTKPS